MSGRNRFPFTATQWQELEHQALIFKYMVSGTPIPPDLLKRNLDYSKVILHQPPQQHNTFGGWECFNHQIQMGFGRKIDPEPGRCRRTDGKKWRCSKEAYPDSKYCERHMHRGRNRSRKPVEVMSITSTTTSNPLKTPTTPIPPISSITKIPNPPPSYSLSSVASESNTHHLHHPSYYNTHFTQHFLQAPHSFSSSSRPPGPGLDLSSQENTTHLLFDSSRCSNPNEDYRCGCGMKEEVDEHHAFLSGSSGTVRSYSGSSTMDDDDDNDPWQLTTPMTMVGSSSVAHLKQRTSCSALQSGYPFLQLQGLTTSTVTDNTTSKQQKQDHHHHQQQQHFHFLGTSDIVKCEKIPLKIKRGEDDKPQKVMHHFFDEWPKSKDSENKSSNSTAQLSISIPNSTTTSHDFFMIRNGH